MDVVYAGFAWSKIPARVLIDRSDYQLRYSLFAEEP